MGNHWEEGEETLGLEDLSTECHTEDSRSKRPWLAGYGSDFEITIVYSSPP